MSALKFAGMNRRNAVFTSRNAVITVNTRTLSADVSTGALTASAAEALSPGKAPADLVFKVAEAALTAATSKDLHVDRVAGLARSYAVPTKIRALAAAAKDSGGLTPESERAATLLSSSTHVSASTVRWLHAFFQHADSASVGAARWNAWGGNAGLTWASGIAGKLGLDALTADASGLEEFSVGSEDTRAFWGSMTASGKVNAVFRQDPAGWMLWSNGGWHLSDRGPSPRAELDDVTALHACGALLDAPDSEVDVRHVAPEEWSLFAAASGDLDLQFLDLLAVTAAAADDYTSEERSENASSQARDANGRFAKAGDQGLMKSLNMRGTIKSVTPDGKNLVVQGDDGNSYMLDPKDFEVDGGSGGTATGKPDPSSVVNMPDFSQILGQPRASKNTPKAWLPSLLQPMGPAQLKQVVSDYSGFVTSERNKAANRFAGGTGWEESKPQTAKEKADAAARKKNIRQSIKTYEDFFKEYRKGPKTKQAQKLAERDIDRIMAGKKPLRASGAGEAPEGSEEPTTPLNELPPEGGAADALTPESSDVKPLYMALVDRDDPRAVLELVCLVPASKTNSTVTTFKRAGGEWVQEPKILQDLRSATPPPTVVLRDEELESVLVQVDNEVPEEPEEPAGAEAVTAAYKPVLTLAAAGGADRNRGGAEHLRRYWTTGKGGAKIRWGTPGDWRRCVRQLSKHLGPRSKGYCALRHKEMNGMWPGDKRNRKSFSLSPDGPELFTYEEIRRIPAVIRAAAYEAGARAALAKFNGEPFQPIPVSVDDITEGRSGRAFKIPVVVPEGLSSGDKRHFRKGALGIRTLPLPLMWQIQTGEGHDGAVIVGRIDYMERTPFGLGNAYGVFDTGPYAQEAQRLIENGMLRWVSVDLDKFEVDEDASERDPDGKMHIKKGRSMGVTLVAKPAFQECTLEMLPLADKEAGPVDAKVVKFPSIIASAGIAKAIPVEPPSSWFQDPRLSGPSPIKVTDEGQVFGHIATWRTSHIGLANATPPPRSQSGYAYFHTGVVRTAEGSDVTVGQLTLAGGHASLDKDAAAAAKHYDDTASALADVHAGEDSYGIWVAGALRPGTTAEQIRAFRASAPSGDWRYMPGHGLEMIAVCQVNVPGFPVPRALAASGHMNALVAAGTADLIALQTAQQSGELDLQALAAAATQRLVNVLGDDGTMLQTKVYSPKKSAELSASGIAMADGKFAVENASDLRRALQELASSSMENKGPARRHLVARARVLGLADRIPAHWRENSFSDRRLNGRLRTDAVVASARLSREAAAVRARMQSFELQQQADELASKMGL